LSNGSFPVRWHTAASRIRHSERGSARSPANDG